MSFAAEVKDELMQTSRQLQLSGRLSPCCRHAEMYGLFLLCRDFDCDKISINTENEALAALYARYVMLLTNKRAQIKKSESGKYRVSPAGAQERKKLLAAFGHTGSEVTRRLNRANLEFDCCVRAFLRGAFLACGTLTNPEIDYHLEFTAAHRVLCGDLMKLLCEADFHPRRILRKGSPVLYFKDSESIEDLLAFTGATESALKLMGTRMYKDVRNRVNRRVNFENANSSRAFDAAYRQIEAIRYIEKKAGLSSLPEELRELALLRKENGDFTLRDLADNLSEDISKSGVNHRLKKILDAAEELRKSEEAEKASAKGAKNAEDEKVGKIPAKAAEANTKAAEANTKGSDDSVKGGKAPAKGAEDSVKAEKESKKAEKEGRS